MKSVLNQQKCLGFVFNCKTSVNSDFSPITMMFLHLKVPKITIKKLDLLSQKTNILK